MSIVIPLNHSFYFLPPNDQDLHYNQDSSSGSGTTGYRSAKYTPAEWFSNYHSILQQAGTDHHEAQSIQRESRTLYQDTEEATLKTQAEGTRLLGERLQDIHYWKSELQRHIDHLLTDTETLLALKTRLEKALDATETPYAITTDNLNCRTRRLGPDLVQDTVEEELIKVNIDRTVNIREVKCYKLERYLITQSTTQAQLPCRTMCNRSSWMKFSQDNLNKALQEEQATNSLRLLVEQVLQDTTEDLRVQCSKVDQAFSQRCVELVQAKTQLEMKLTKVHRETDSQNILVLQKAINNKEAPLRVAQSRLYLRSLRPNMELCRDEPQLSLEGEVRQIDATLTSLNQQLSEVRSSLSHLEESRMALEKDINCKTHSLFIDRDKCMTHRKRYPTVSTLSGY
uniref:Tektin n=1 Tax=Anabas testudineus TaxID=64144 RepID=A0A3Q1K4D2_ANATE